MLGNRTFLLRSARLLSSREMANYTKVGVVGLGLMGHGVAQAAAQAGYKVLGIETAQAAIDIGLTRIQGSLSKSYTKEVAKGKLTEADAQKKVQSILSNITTSTKIEDAKDCDIIIEMIVENMQVKLDFYKKLGAIAKPSAVFCSNTSSLPITAMAVASGRPDKFVGLHFFNPVQLMKLVEVVSTTHTNPEVFKEVSDFGKSLGKTTVAAKDTPGFIVNRLLVPYLIQAMSMVDRADASVADIDVSMQLGASHPMGPIVLADYIGLDTCLHIIKGWRVDFPNEPAFFVPKCLEDKVAAGNLGRKSGKGFYTWTGDKVGAPVA